MNYKKFDMGSYNMHIIKTNRFKTITLKIFFKEKIKKENITKRNFLTEILLQSSSQYKSQKDLLIETENLYDLSIGSKTSFIGDYSILNFSSTFLNEKYTEKGYINKSFDFVFDLLFKPNTKDKKFDELSFKKTYNKLKEDIESLKDNPSQYSILKMFEHMDKKSSISFNPVGYLEDLEDLDTKNLYEYYEQVLKNNIVDIFVIGDFDIEEIKNILVDKIKINTLKKPAGTHLLEYKKFRNTPKTFKEKLKINQSKLVIGFKLKELTDFERRYVLPLFNTIFGGGADSRLFKNVREKHSLCYHISSNIKSINSVMYIKAGIAKKDFKKALKLIKKEFSELKTNITDEEIRNAKTNFINNCNVLYDSQGAIIKTYLNKEYLGSDLIDEKIVKVDEVTKENLVKLISKITLDTIFLLEGSNNEETNA